MSKCGTIECAYCQILVNQYLHNSIRFCITMSTVSLIINYVILAESDLDRVKYYYNPQRRPRNQFCLFSNSTDVVSSGIYFNGYIYLDHAPYKKHVIDKTSPNKIEVGVMVDPAQGFKSQVEYSF